MKLTEINLNWMVRVRLTDRGREIHRENYRRFDLLMPGFSDRHPYKPPTEDADGWSRFQLWELMNIFGRDMDCGVNIPMETGVVVEVEDYARPPLSSTGRWSDD